MRLSVYLAIQYNLSRRFVKQMIKQGKVTFDSKAVLADIEIEDGRNYRIEIESPVLQYDVNSYLLKKTGNVIFFYKPPFMHTERNTPLDDLCLGDIVNAEFPSYRLISRLDYGVDGVIAGVYKDVAAYGEEKAYLAWVNGSFPDNCTGFWKIDADKCRKVKAFESVGGGKMEFRCIKRTDSHSLTEITLESAKRHQVRAVCAELGCPIAGDPLYSASGSASGRIALHCSRVSLNGIIFESPYKKSFENSFILESL